MRLHSFTAFLLGSASSLITGMAWAQTPSDPEPAVLDEVVVTGRYGAETAVAGTKMDTPIIEVPQSVAVVTEDLITERRPATLTEMLFNVSGVVDSGSRRGFDNIVIRGFTASSSVYLDGLRVERGNFNVAQEPFGLARVEVLKGPGSVLFGQGSLGGIVNQVSKRPTGDARFDVEAMAGSFGTFQGAVDAEFPLTTDGRWSTRVVGLYRERGDSIDFNGKDRFYVTPSLAWDGGDTRFILRGNVTRDRHEGTYVGVPLEGSILPNPNGEIDRSLYIGEPDQDVVRTDRYQIGYEFERDFGAGWTARQSLRYSDTDVYSAATFSSGLNPDLRTLRRGSAIFQQVEDATAIDNQLRHRFTGERFENTFLIGADLLFQAVDQSFTFSSFPTLDIFAPVYGGPRGPSFPILNFTQDDTLYGFYVQNQIKLWDRLTVLVGGRYDVSETESFNRLTSVGREQKEEDFTFRGGVTLEVADGINLFASYAEAFNPNFGLDAFGDPFEPERGTQYEAGVKTDLNGGRIRSTFAVYDLTRENVLVAFPAFPGTQIQTGEQRSRGFEADLAWDVTDAWSLTAAYAYTDVEVVEDTNPLLIGDRPANVPEHQANLWSTWEISLGGGTLTLGGGGRYVGEREGILPNSYRIPSYAVADALASYRIDRWRVQLNAYNLFDENYVDSGSPTGTRTVLLGEPFTMKLSVGFAL